MTRNDSQTDALRASVLDRFRKLATAPGQEQKFSVGPESAKHLGYDDAGIDSLPASATESFCGVGNPFSLGEPRAGEVVLDLGCGAGLDTLLAARRVGESGKAVGLDLSTEMVAKARRNASLLGLANVEFLHGEIESLPLPDASIDLAISNGVFNLCPDKPGVLREVYRVLKPGGRLQMADILRESHVSAEEAAKKGTWSD
jgi:arsenite methyltransferase